MISKEALKRRYGNLSLSDAAVNRKRPSRTLTFTTKMSPIMQERFKILCNETNRSMADLLETWIIRDWRMRLLEIEECEVYPDFSAEIANRECNADKRHPVVGEPRSSGPLPKPEEDY